MDICSPEMEWNCSELGRESVARRLIWSTVILTWYFEDAEIGITDIIEGGREKGKIQVGQPIIYPLKWSTFENKRQWYS